MNKRIVAMILAGGKGTRLESLTRKIAKPAVSYGGKYRIIDFPLSNCANSGIDTVGVLTQYESVALDTYIGNGEKWGLNGVRSLTTTLHPRQTEEGLSWYRGTADAIYANLDFLDSVSPQYVLILSGDHIYSTTYNEMLKQHIERGADCTISVIEVDPKEASRFGILVTDEKGAIIKFQEKPKNPISNLASMGVYIFTYSVLRRMLVGDARKKDSSHDFGKDIIPTMLAKKMKLFAYVFKGYWKDVGTISSLHEANMDLLLSSKGQNIYTIKGGNTIFSEDTHSHPQYIGRKARVKDCLINQGAVILGDVERSVISNEVVVAEGAVVKNSVLMPGARIRAGAKVFSAIVGPEAIVSHGEVVNEKQEDIVLITTRRKNNGK
ncbi:MAG: glucose-1-phosphate adenylyltransferase [Bacilli bacterium]|jgi:glucose-1-phosphate adenylyltransferase|nr:glucose-1-phosphate adenylyltransferase [Bacilli bacterium]NCA94906.1 glucose-1-phosphate adenylyltransferase [Campylobacterota bacterium]NLB40089.1 glucose-1-phosphate adenylyltransferase [Erysipelotrichaceae bacterium]HOH67996.1 glucose-1-phosphate adenylyltransferase [Bacilli bacterium]HPM07410.1 glucose-1-phosphate adenylyltransferase [Bacilli bacterium]